MQKRPFSATLGLGVALLAYGTSAIAVEQPTVATLQPPPIELTIPPKVTDNPFNRLVTFHDKILTFGSWDDMAAAFIRSRGLFAFEETLIVIQDISKYPGKVCATGIIRDFEHPDPEPMFGCVWERSLETKELAWVDPGDGTDPLAILAATDPMAAQDN